MMNKAINERKSMLLALVFAAFSLMVSNLTYAFGDLGENETFRDSAVKHAQEALSHASQSHGAETYDHAAKALESVRSINSEMWSSKQQKASSRIRIAGAVAKKGDFEKATKLLTEAVQILKQLKN